MIKNLSEKSLEDFERRIEESSVPTSYSFHICSSTFIWLDLKLVSSTFFLQKEFWLNRKYLIEKNF